MVMKPFWLRHHVDMAIWKAAGLFVGRDYIAPPREARKRSRAHMPLRGMRPLGRGAIA